MNSTTISSTSPNPPFSPQTVPSLSLSVPSSLSFPPSVKLATEAFWRIALWMDCGGGRGCIEGNMHRVITVSPLGELQMATQGCYMAEGLKGANSQPFAFMHAKEKERLPLRACTILKESSH
ncbi:hypothetical protein QQF64_021079 [Cirrhinus molitorella]|uniref:Uncharacterized protein n=1 Tax=Cirrhinus molitorella TaxID=172907 RepID=A0ABR3LEF5_9TELE